MTLLRPTPMLPDETVLDAIALPTRIRNPLKFYGLKTVGDVREASDASLFSKILVWDRSSFAARCLGLN